MSNLETLKQELLLQKTAIENKGGTVAVANTNPSPSEITAGINSIELPTIDLSDSTATEADVLTGKTFYSGDTTLKTGTLEAGLSDKLLRHLFLYNPNEATSDEEIYYAMPNDLTTVKKYLFHSNPNKITLTLPESITKIEDYAFYNCTNFNFTNLNTLPNLSAIGNYGLEGLQCIDHENLWPTLKTVAMRGLANTASTNSVINLPALTSISSYAFASTTGRVNISSIDFSKIETSILFNYAFSCLITDCDFTLPSATTSIGAYCFYRGSFNNITIPTSCTQVSDYCFGGLSTDELDTYKLKTFTFESETPPKCGKYIISTLHIDNGALIYVPDTAVETYKNTTNLTYYSSSIKPISEKP